jgi:nucleotide-binding universal stress UspA family protein
MTYKDMMVLLDDTRESDQRLQTALELAERHAAHLVGLAVSEPFYVPTLAQVEIAALEQRQRDIAADRDRRLQERFEARVRASSVSGEWRSPEEEPYRDLLDVLAEQSRYCDLLILGQTDPDATQGLASDFPGQVALMAGRPVLALPYAWRPEAVGRQVLVAWNGGREASRAVHDAMPLLQQADSVRVLTLTGGRGRGAGSQPEVDLATHLARHGVKVEAATLSTADLDVSDALLSTAADHGSDLIVMGAYGRSRMRELILGGTTLNMLRHMTVPLLIAH